MGPFQRGGWFIDQYGWAKVVWCLLVAGGLTTVVTATVHGVGTLSAAWLAVLAAGAFIFVVATAALMVSVRGEGPMKI